jgi:hypothetical protein
MAMKKLVFPVKVIKTPVVNLMSRDLKQNAMKIKMMQNGLELANMNIQMSIQQFLDSSFLSLSFYFPYAGV